MVVVLLGTGKRKRQSSVLKWKLKNRPDALVLGLDLFFCLALAETDWKADA